MIKWALRRPINPNRKIHLAQRREAAKGDAKKSRIFVVL
jgi:hypothetical protein